MHFILLLPATFPVHFHEHKHVTWMGSVGWKNPVFNAAFCANYFSASVVQHTQAFFCRR
jgi:hypothetical protein